MWLAVVHRCTAIESTAKGCHRSLVMGPGVLKLDLTIAPLTTTFRVKAVQPGSYPALWLA